MSKWVLYKGTSEIDLVSYPVIFKKREVVYPTEKIVLIEKIKHRFSAAM
jgi:hypothetical protein